TTQVDATARSPLGCRTPASTGAFFSSRPAISTTRSTPSIARSTVVTPPASPNTIHVAISLEKKRAHVCSDEGTGDHELGQAFTRDGVREHVGRRRDRGGARPAFDRCALADDLVSADDADRFAVDGHGSLALHDD